MGKPSLTACEFGLCKVLALRVAILRPPWRQLRDAVGGIRGAVNTAPVSSYRRRGAGGLLVKVRQSSYSPEQLVLLKKKCYELLNVGYFYRNL